MNKEDYKKIEELFHKMSEHDKNILKEFLLSHQEEFKADPVETVRKGLYNSLIDDGRVQEEMLQQKREAMYIDEETKTVEPTPVNIFVDNNYIKKEPYLNGIEIGNAGDNIISEKDPHTKLLEELKSKFASMSYTDLYEFVKGFYLIQDDSNYQKLPIMSQQMAWNNEMHTQNLSNFFDSNYYLKNGITPEEFISTAFETYKKYGELNKQGKTKK